MRGSLLAAAVLGLTVGVSSTAEADIIASFSNNGSKHG